MYSTAELLKKIDKLVCIYDVWPLFDRYEPERYKDERNLIWSKCSDDCKEEDFEQVYFIFFFINEYNKIAGKNGSFHYTKKTYTNNINASSLNFYSHILEELCHFPVEIYKFSDEMKIILPNKEEKIIKLTINFVEEAKNHIEQYLTDFFDSIESEPVKENISKKWDIFVKSYLSRNDLEQNIKAYIDKSLMNFERIRNNSFIYLIDVNKTRTIKLDNIITYSDMHKWLENEFSIILEKEGLYKNINASKKYSIMSRI